MWFDLTERCTHSSSYSKFLVHRTMRRLQTEPFLLQRTEESEDRITNPNTSWEISRPEDNCENRCLFFLRPNITCLWLFKYQPTNYPPYCSRVKLVDASAGSFAVEMLKHRRRAIVIHYFDFTLHTLHSIFLTFELTPPLSLAPVWFILCQCQCPRLFGSNTASIGSLFALMIFNNWLKASRRDDILK